MLRNRRTRASLFGPLISVLAVIVGLVLVGPVSPASSTPGNGNNGDCVPSGAVPASFSDWTDSGTYTAWQTSDTATDPDGQSGEDNPLNLQRIGAVDQRTVVDQEASEETVVDAPAVAGQHYSLKGNSGIDADEIPPTPDQNPDIWQANTEQEPAGHYNSTQQADDSTYVEGESGLHYASHGSSGNRDWFYYRAPVPEQTHVEHTDAITHTEYRWSVETRTYTPAKDAVTCDHNPPGNNGTIKVDDDGLPGCNVGHSQGNGICDNGVGNDPHLGCQFYVEWYNYEADATSTVTFEVQAPTGGTVTAVQGRVAPDTVQLDSDDASGANEDGFDGAELYQLSFTDAPQQNHGWHVKVTTHTTWANGSDEKSKVFWVEGDCRQIPDTPAVTMHDECGTANDSGPTYTHENDYWTTTEGEGVIYFHAKEGYFFPAGEHTSEDGKTYTVSYTPNTDVPCEQVQDASAAVVLNTAQTCETGQSASPGAINGASWNEGASTVFGPGSYSFVATAASGYLFPAGEGVSDDGTTKTFSGELLGPDTTLCTPRKPNPVPVTEEVEGCDLSAYGLEPGSGHRDGLRDWVLVDGQWELQDMADVVWGSWMQDDTLTDEEYQELCAGPQPQPQTRTVHHEDSGCTLGGVRSYDEVFTTPYVWDPEAQEWVLGEETGPVVENDVFTAYTVQEMEDLGCVEIEGEQGHEHHGGGTKHHPEVKGEQATVPSEVEAGLAGPVGQSQEAPTGGSSLPLWALALGAGLFLSGARRLRRTS